MSKRKRDAEKSGRLNTGLNAEELPLTRSASDVTPKRIFIRTFGCQMNSRDSEALAGLFMEGGYSISESAEEADVVLVNTCSVRAHAEDRAISYLGSLKKISQSTVHSQQSTEKEKKKSIDYRLSTIDSRPLPKAIVGLIGCMAVNRGEEIFKKMPHIDLICGPASFNKILGYVERIVNEGRGTRDERRNRRIIDINDGEREENFYQSSFRADKSKAQVVISTGCSNYCSYCVVPYVRGRLRLRKPSDIIDEVKRNVSLGIKKITLLGQNVNDYLYRSTFHVPRSTSFVDLLKMIDGIEGVEEISFITSQPKNTSKELFALIEKSSKIRKHLHLPFQSGSNRILKMMNRGYTREKYLQLVDDYKKIVGGTLSTDVIAGFPTEGDEDFNQTKDILERVKFSHAFIFKYSPRRAAKSFELADDVPKDVKIKRHKILLDLQKKISLGKR